MLDITRLRVIEAIARLGSVTATARELHYTQPTISHHLARLEAETGALLVQRAGRGIRLTPEGRLLASRAVEILGRIDAADAELSAHVGLRAGRVRVASFSSVIGSLIPRAVAALTEQHPALRIDLTGAQPPEALDLLRAGRVDVAIVFRYEADPPEPDDVHLRHLLDDRLHLLSTRTGDTVAGLRDATWIAGCARCRRHLVALCAANGFEPRIGYTSEDTVVIQGLVAAGLGVTICPGLALRAHHARGVVANEMTGTHQHVFAATWGAPPIPPATGAFVAALVESAASIDGVDPAVGAL